MTTEREKVVGVRVSAAEFTRIDRAANKVGLKASQYLRMVGLRQAERELKEAQGDEG